MSELDPKTIETIVTSGGVTGIIVAVAAMLRKVWRELSRERVDTKTDSATMDLIDSMSKELDRVAGEINEIKKHHQAEKQELIEKINKLQATMENIKAKNESMRAAAMDAYAHFVSISREFDHKTIEEITNKLFRIAFGQVEPK